LKTQPFWRQGNESAFALAEERQVSLTLILGASGMLGQALMTEGGRQGHTVLGASRSGPGTICDVTDAAALSALIETTSPGTVVNAAALTDLVQCERDPGLAYAVNGRTVALLAELCRGRGVRLVQISTDQYFTGDGRELHDERSQVRLLNDYARSKFAGESFAMTLPDALVLRTNITGLRGWAGRPTFAEWLIEAILNETPITLFEDYITSTLDTRSFAKACWQLIDDRVVGLFNVASSQPASKLEFAGALAQALGRPLGPMRTGSVSTLTPRRAESVALSVAAAERQLGYRLPGLDAVVRNLVSDYRAPAAVSQAVFVAHKGPS